MGAWIEISALGTLFLASSVAPLVGAWIEIFNAQKKVQSVRVAPLVGAWIEIVVNGNAYKPKMSLLSWERGLKYGKSVEKLFLYGRSSRGSVD